jgi:hypothetical protein
VLAPGGGIDIDQIRPQSQMRLGNTSALACGEHQHVERRLGRYNEVGNPLSVGTRLGNTSALAHRCLHKPGGLDCHNEVGKHYSVGTSAVCVVPARLLSQRGWEALQRWHEHAGHPAYEVVVATKSGNTPVLAQSLRHPSRCVTKGSAPALAPVQAARYHLVAPESNRFGDDAPGRSHRPRRPRAAAAPVSGRLARHARRLVPCKHR